MGSVAQISRERIRRLLDAVVWPATNPATAQLSLSISRLPGEPIPASEATTLTYAPFRTGEGWGGAWSTAWIRAEGEIPDSFAGRHVVARVNIGYFATVGFGGEALAYRGWDDPVPLQGLNPRHNTIEISPSARAGERVELLVEAAANPPTVQAGLTGALLMPDYDGAPLYRLHQFDLAVVDDEMMALLYDWLVLAELVDALGLEHRRSARILAVLDRVTTTVDLSDPRASLLARRDEWAALLDEPAAPGAHQVTAVGHAHIDSAWLWPLRETRRKCARTFSSALRLMEAHPDFVFVCSQAQQHSWVEEDHPELFEQMRQAVARGQLEPVGSMWVEPDTNLPSGESLARQLVHGKRYFLDRYGVETTDCWLPDAFGYSGNLPQILRAAGVTRFLTQKLSWNEIDVFPHHTFWWEGIDGSRVLAHCPPTDTYNGDFTVGQVVEGDRRFAEHGVSNRSLYVYGYGDGGGGPTEEMLERARRIANLDPLPRVSLGTAAGYFQSLEDEAERADERSARSQPETVQTAHAPGPGGLPIWRGELYLERHRGVQTSQAESKLGNRRSEALLREAELWAVLALDGAEAARAAERLDAAWKTVLLHQFHDILPGSSIHWVYRDSRAAYESVADIAGAVIEKSTRRLAARVAGSGGSPSGAPAFVVLNPATRERSGVVEIPAELASRLVPDGSRNSPIAARLPGGTLAPVQRLGGGGILVAASVPGSGWLRLELASESAGGAELEPGLEHAVTVTAADGPDGAGSRTLSNGRISVTIDSDGLVSSIVDHENGREIVAEGERANVLQLHHDLPNHYDAWDVDQGAYERAVECAEAISVETSETGPVRATVTVSRHVGEASTIVQQIRVAAGSRRVEFSTDVDWHERHRMLKVAFPLAISSPHATYEIPFGLVERPTHANTTWDSAKFEVPAQRFADLSEHGMGVALLNDCKHGYDVRANVMRLSLLRGPAWPDPEADLGVHRFVYAIVPHGAQAGADDVAHEAESLNLPFRVVECAASGDEPGLPASGSIAEVSGALVSALKHADDGSGDVVLRLYEPLGAHTTAVLSGLGMTGATRGAARCDLLERELEGGAVRVTDGALRLPLTPFEIVTLRLSRSN